MSTENVSAANLASAGSTRHRIVWVDVCKGICIILVVYGHVSGGLGVAGVVKANSFWLSLRAWVYLFHMAAFFSLSGYFAPQLAKLPAWEFLKARLRTVGYPYLIWTAILVTAQFAMANFVNNPVDFHQAMRFLVEPYGFGLWFLYALFINSMVFYLLIRWLGSSRGVLGVAVLLSFLAWHNVFSFWPILDQAMEYFIFYAFAACLPEKIVNAISAANPLKMLFCGSSLLLAMTFLFYESWSALWFGALTAAMLGIVGVVCVSQVLGQTCVGLWWAFLGAYSLEIYLGHPLWGTLARVILERAKIHSGAGLIFGVVGIAVGASLAVGVLCRACHFPWLFKWPSKKSAVA